MIKMIIQQARIGAGIAYVSMILYDLALLELATKNERAAKLISSCKNLCELVKIFDTLSKKYFLHYNVRVKEFRNEVAASEKFAVLPLERQKEMFIRMLDLNQLYVNVSDRHDTAAGLTQNDIAFTEDFYRLKND